eukprot:CAMPEP_0204440684 /NCGR_PEP_ID=MMETSP0470-20130426/83785_1 /ASSEMBLY_ACC=CAM_ASM_000385 /TAXON_ID=2969 /ORGANISM="Oxyrrhis marina" /LENGTH=176 /DNA_ID=CAMNT_0051439719 /DNA_START=401 /DNA_END=931 /DNA_ORIENTATION=+
MDNLGHENLIDFTVQWITEQEELRLGADQPCRPGEEVREEPSKYRGDQEGPDEPLPGLIGRQGQEGRPDKPLPAAHPGDIGKTIVGDHQSAGNGKPENTFKNQVHCPPHLHHSQAQDGHSPNKIPDLVLVEPRPQRKHVGHEDAHVPGEGDEPVVVQHRADQQVRLKPRGQSDDQP